MQTIDVKHLAERQREGEIDLIDVRTPAEFASVHADGARNIPLETLDPSAISESRNGRSGEPLYVICRSGNRSGQAVKRFSAAGIENVVNVNGGTVAWDRAGLPVVRGKQVLPLDRQMRILAGSLIVLGVLLSLVYPASIWLAGFMGAGLVFAGITDICPLSSTLARMPWNQRGDDASCCRV